MSTSRRMCINWYTLGLAIFFPIAEAIQELFSQGDIFKPMLYSKRWKKMGPRHPWAFSQLTDLSRSTLQTRLHLPNAVSKDKGFSEWSSLSLHPSLHCESTIFSWAICTQTATNFFTAYCWKLYSACYTHSLSSEVSARHLCGLLYHREIKELSYLLSSPYYNWREKNTPQNVIKLQKTLKYLPYW